MRSLVVILLLAGCGRISFDPVLDGATGGDAVTDSEIDASLCGAMQHRLFPTQTYDAAVTQCAAIGGWLVTIDDVAENNLVLAMNATEVWIGYNDLAVEGTFAWVGPTSSYTNWNSGQPNDGAGGTTEDCGGMRTTGVWHDEDCTTEAFAFVCECP